MRCDVMCRDHSRLASVLQELLVTGPNGLQILTTNSFVADKSLPNLSILRFLSLPSQPVGAAAQLF